MSAPTQVLPSWLTLSTTVITAPGGVVTTSSTTLRLPLTYYGPSIPLGTDGSWTYGGLAPPAPSTSTSVSAISTPSVMSSVPSSTSSTLSSTLPPSTSSTLSSTLPLSTSLLSSLFTSSASSSSASPSFTSPVTSAPASSSSAAGAVAGGHSTISASELGAILGAILGSLLLAILVLVVLLLRRHKGGAKRSDPVSTSGSSFWNRQTTLFSRRGSRRQTPIWTEWQMVNPDDTHENGGADERVPGEGSPRGSGEEDDPFLTRSLRSGTNEMTQTKTGTDTLVSMPAAAAVAGGSTSTRRSGAKIGGPIIPRDELLARMNEDQGAASPWVLVTDASPPEHTSPLLPPPPIGSERRSLRGVRGTETKSTRSLGSQALSLTSEKSSDSLGEQEPAQLFTARRVKVPHIEEEAGPSAWHEPSGLERLANLPRLSWFRRMSFLGSPIGSRNVDEDAAVIDPYTRTPPRMHSRQGSRSRPVSWAPLPTHEPVSPDSSVGRRPRPQSGLGADLGLIGDRPISSVSAKSRASAASGGTVYHDARSTPASSMVDVTSPVGTLGSSGRGAPPVPSLPRQVSSNSGDTPRMTTSGGYLSVAGDPPSYEESNNSSSSPSTQETAADTIDVLDIPAPRPASPFSAASSRPDFPPGLVPLPTPRAWRDSHITSGSAGSAGIQIDVLEDEPPPAQDGWRSLASGGGWGPSEGRRTTFGMPVVSHPRNAHSSERGSLHSMRSHLSPHSPLNTSGSAPASSLHTYHSSSSRPSTHSQGLTASSGGSLAHSASISEDERRPRRRGGVGEVGSPPVSAVFSREGPWEGRTTSPLAQNPLMRPMTPIRQSPSSSSGDVPNFPTPVTLSGTVTSSGTTRTDDSNAHSSVTTALTDPITGAVLHFPALPWRHAQDHSWTGHDDDNMW